ncbi:acetylserotonin O-methyltransferase-like isoform X1 [Sceloporus undulatus]|uniref:acetylserotonin O-methyltransferase-like isoform X1 n=1 Tax=Sceloporus undulatus TaxID=8520 RepID=UPI001C4CC152|nr:acetylserotonin O-methyltransferase-like isoform X1 [Sceloporus undulatus]
MDSAEENEMLKLLFQYQHGFIISKIMFTACELGIFDLLLESRDTLSSAAIAARLGTSHMGMKRLLEACVGLKLLKMERKSNEGFYGNTDLGNLCLAKSSPKSQYYYMKFYSEFTYPNFQYLADAVREGKPQVQPAYVTPAKDIFASMYSSDEGVQRFSNAMDSAWSLYGQEMMSAFDLSCFPVVCDLGGGSGALAKEYISLYPNATVTIFDLPKVVKTAKKQFVSSEECKISFQDGDFFKDPVPEADLYILARIFHDWDDNTCMQLLTKVHKACKPGGGLLLLEVALNEDRSGPLEAHIRSIMMLLFTTGRERTLSEYNALLSAGGFKEIQFKKRSFYSAVLGRK